MIGKINTIGEIFNDIKLTHHLDNLPDLYEEENYRSRNWLWRKTEVLWKTYFEEFKKRSNKKLHYWMIYLRTNSILKFKIK